jgi:hypothetical protein
MTGLAATGSSTAKACEPAWVRPIPRSSAALGRVQTVNRLEGKVIIRLIRPKAKTPARLTIRYDNIPLTCAWQTFHEGEDVYVVDSEWAAAVSRITFDQSRH